MLRQLQERESRIIWQANIGNKLMSWDDLAHRMLGFNSSFYYSQILVYSPYPEASEDPPTRATKRQVDKQQRL